MQLQVLHNITLSFDFFLSKCYVIKYNCHGQSRLKSITFKDTMVLSSMIAIIMFHLVSNGLELWRAFVLHLASP